MYPLSGQIQRASDASKFAAQRLSRIEAPKFPDDETTLAQLRQRVADTIAYLQGLAPQADGAESRKVTLSFGDFKPEFQGDAYLLSFALPNFYFHVATAYGILRNQGVKIGKLDFRAVSGLEPGLSAAATSGRRSRPSFPCSGGFPPASGRACAWPWTSGGRTDPPAGRSGRPRTCRPPAW